MAIIEINHVVKSYGSCQVLKGIDLSLEKGKIIGLMGPNGSGKTSLLKILGGYDSYYEGDVRIDGQTPGPHSRSLVSYLPDRPSIPLHWTPSQAISTYKAFFKDFNEEKAYGMLEGLDMDPSQKVGKMSKGMQEKIAIVMAMARDAQIYLLDEPISGVDPAARKVILRVMIENYSPDALMILSTHQITDIEPLIDDVIFLKRGEVVLHGPADMIRAQENKSIKQIFEEVFQ